MNEITLLYLGAALGAIVVAALIGWGIYKLVG